VVPKLSKEFSYRNVHQVPKLTKIVVNIGLGEATQNPKLLDGAVVELAAITGQKPSVRRARKSIANFKLRQGQRIGAMVTLRGDRMWEFFDRLVNVSLPRVRDFKGCSPKAFDGRGNYSLGIREHIIFPEVDYDKVEKIVGLNVTLCTTANSDAEARALLTQLGVPFRN
jgi:large subunit ribosomal protein L5